MTLPRLSTNAWGEGAKVCHFGSWFHSPTPSVFKFNSQTLFHSLTECFWNGVFKNQVVCSHEKKELLLAFDSWVTLLQALKYWHLSMRTRPLLISCNMTSLLTFFLSSVSVIIFPGQGLTAWFHTSRCFIMVVYECEPGRVKALHLDLGVWIHSHCNFKLLDAFFEIYKSPRHRLVYVASLTQWLWYCSHSGSYTEKCPFPVAVVMEVHLDCGNSSKMHFI